MQKNTVEKQIWGIVSSSLQETSSNWNSSLEETSYTSNRPRPLPLCHAWLPLCHAWLPRLPRIDAELEENFELELVSRRDEFHLKWNLQLNSPPERKKQKEKQKEKLCLSLNFGFKSWNSTLSVSSVSVSKAQKLKLSRSQLSYSLGLNSLCPSLSPSQLALTGSGDHRKSGKKFLFHLPLLNKNFPMTLYVPCKCIRLSYKSNYYCCVCVLRLS